MMQCEQFALKKKKKSFWQAFREFFGESSGVSLPQVPGLRQQKHNPALHGCRRERSTPGASPTPTSAPHHSHGGENNEMLYFPHPHTYIAHAFIFMQVSHTQHSHQAPAVPTRVPTAPHAPLKFIMRHIEKLQKCTCLSR